MTMVRPNDTTAEGFFKLWDIPETLEFVRGVENFVYKSKSGDYFLRLTQESHRQLHEVQSELEWMDRLSS
ncbi:MAG: hypothetical protein HRT44_10340, partial [Bdellovibrionales bacterium]|nr:hypothetical protein [Bdellovibrionales bacterium]NQZ19638.1 hypothetical protein [Bdellovibrionales bacterium]